MVIRTVLLALCSMVFAVSASAQQNAAPIVFPKDKSIVGSRINLVLDPTEVPFFQVIIGETEYPVVDTSTGKHAFQGLELEPGLNTITVKIFTAPSPEDNENVKGEGNKEAKTANKGETSKQKLVLLSTWQRQVFSMRGVSTVGAAPAGFNKEPFHSRERETGCSGCHDLDAPSPDAAMPKKPEDMICYSCHRKIPTGKYIHGPAAVWYCLGCHNPDLYPVKYQFESVDPWVVVKSIQPVIPQLFTLASGNLFKPDTADFIDKETAVAAMKDILAYLTQNPGERMRIEVHTDNKPLTKQKLPKGKKQAFKSNQALTAARARTLALLVKAQGIPEKRFTAVGMGETLAKSLDTTPKGRELNNRVEIVVYPDDVKVVNSQKLPILTDRKRVFISLQYGQGPAVSKIRVNEEIAKDLQYVAGSSYYKGKALAPASKGNPLQWELGEMEPNSEETLIFVIQNRNKKSEVPISDTVSLTYGREGHMRSRVFDPKLPEVQSYTIQSACFKCHKDSMHGSFKHGPVEAGYCTLCHNPHASGNATGLRKSEWDLCVTCHSEKATERHVLVGRKKKKTSHPTKHKHDPSRPGKHLTCVSCHDGHGAESSYFYKFGAKQRDDTCRHCHGNKFK